MSEKPIERLNYFNGQRLEAGDLRLEQEYHIQVQRWLMKTLFWPGVARGFDVKIFEGGKKIRLEPGLALDDLGRAIILVAPVELTPQARLLCIRYAEHKERPQQEANCAANVGGGATVPARRGGGPERILSQPDIFWRADPPMHDTRELIIAELQLKPDCSVEKVLAGARHRASPLPVQQVHQISFEGEKDIDENNPKVINFYVRGGRPNSVTLYLRARQFSSLYYSEVARHNHNGVGGGDQESKTFNTGSASALDGHDHSVSLQTVDDGIGHSHVIDSQVAMDLIGPGVGQPIDAGELALSIQCATPILRTLNDGPTPGNQNRGGVRMVVSQGGHVHGVSGPVGAQQELDPTEARHTHSVSFSVSHTSVGSAGVPPRGGNQLSFFKDLTISVGKVGTATIPCTGKILDHIKLSYAGAWGNETSFNGDSNHPLYMMGTGPIRLDLIDGLSFEPDAFKPYEITLSVAPGGEGGCIEYNLYVE